MPCPEVISVVLEGEECEEWEVIRQFLILDQGNPVKDCWTNEEVLSWVIARLFDVLTEPDTPGDAG
jgi:hypothetical protein